MKAKDGGLIDIDDLADGLLQSGLDPAAFDLEDIEVPRAKNVIEFSMSPEYLDTNLWIKQAEQVVKLFAEYCPLCSDKDYLNDTPTDDSILNFQDHIQLLEYSVCPKCHKNKRELFDKQPYELVSCLGQRSGKTALAGGVIVPYQLHRYLCIKNIPRYLGLNKTTLFQIDFSAVTEAQIKDSIWQATSSMLAAAPWFNLYHGLLRAEEKKKGLKAGTLFKTMTSSIYYGNKNIKIGYHAASSAALRGRTRLLAALDEIAHMNQNADAKMSNAEETYISLSNSLRSVRSATDILWDRGDYDTPTALMLNISSPYSQYDKIMSLLKEAETDTRKISFHYSSWEASPLITRSSLASEEMNDPIRFWRDFGAIPPLANSPFISNEKALYSIPGKQHQPLFKTRPRYVSDNVNGGQFIAAELLACTTEKSIPRIVTVDGGVTNNHFAVTVHSLKKSGETIHLICDGAIEVSPIKNLDTNEVISVHFPTMFSLILELATKLNIRCVVYDRWSSINEVQRLRDKKIDAFQYSPKYSDFLAFRNLVTAESYKTPAWEAEKLTDLDVTNSLDVAAKVYLHLGVQIATVREMGKKILKPEYGEDDLFRTAVLASSILISNSTRQKEFLTVGAGNRFGPTTVGVFVSRNSGSLAQNNSSQGNSSIGVVRKRS